MAQVEAFEPRRLLAVSVNINFQPPSKPCRPAASLTKARPTATRATASPAGDVDAGDGINSRDYVFAYGLRNPFGGAWRASDGAHYQVENGPGVDRLAKVRRGVSYGWNGNGSTMFTNAIYNWNPATAPVNKGANILRVVYTGSLILTPSA